MKKFLIFCIFILFGFISFDCSLTQEQFEKSHWNEKTQGPIPTFTETKIKILELEMLPDSSAYYLYIPTKVTDKTINVKNKLRRLYVMGFDITMAWYRPPLGGCNKGGTDIITKTLYPEFFLIRLSKPDDSLYQYNFTRLDSLKSIPCPYDVSFYYPKKLI